MAPMTPEPVQPTRPQPSEPAAIDVVVAAFSALGYALSARAILLLSLIGAFALAMRAMSSQTPASLYVTIAYCVLVVLPVVGLEIRKR